MAPAPLEGIRVLDLSQLTAGPMCTRLLADAGAEVIKVEPPTGDPARGMAPLVVGSEGSSDGAYFLRLAVNKKSVVLDLKTEAGRDACLGLVERCDIVVEAFRPGTMDRLGLGYPVLAARNPAVLMVSLSGFGQPDVLDGPYSERPAYDPIVQAMSGVAHVTGDLDGPPLTVGASIADTVPGIYAAYSTLLAVLQRQRDGLGRHVDVAQYDTMLWVNDRNITAYSLAGFDPIRGAAAAFAPYGVFPASDGHVVIAVIADRQWSGFCDALDRPDLVADPRTSTSAQRAANLATFLGPLVGAWTAQRTRQELTDLLTAHGVPIGPVQTAADVVACPHAAARQMFEIVQHPTLGALEVLAPAVKFSGCTGAPMTPPPRLGEHTRSVLAEVGGLADETLEQLAPRQRPTSPQSSNGA